MKKRNIKKIYFIAIMSFLAVFFLFSLICYFAKFWPGLFENVETYVFYIFLTLAATTCVFETNYFEEKYLLTTFAFPSLLFVFMSMVVLAAGKPIYILIIVLAVLFISFLFYFLFRPKILLKMRKDSNIQFFTLLFFYLFLVTGVTVLSYLVLH